MELTNEQKMAVIMRIIGIAERLLLEKRSATTTEPVVENTLPTVDERTEQFLNDMISQGLSVAEETPTNG